MNRPNRQRFTPNRLPGRDDGRESAYDGYRQAEVPNSHSSPPICQKPENASNQVGSTQDQYQLSYAFDD